MKAYYIPYIIGIIMGIIICNTPNIFFTQKEPIKSATKPCKCLTYHQLMIYSAKYDMYTDSLNYASKKDRPRLEDSVRNYGQILRQNDNP